MPPWLVAPYNGALKELLDLAARLLPAASDELLVTSALAVIALGKQQRLHGRLLLDYTHDELAELLDEGAG